MDKIIYPELSYLITGLCFSVQKNLGRFAREKQYSDALEKTLKNTQVHYEREKIIGDFAEGNRADFIIENKIILEIKSIPYITKKEYYQIQRYLKASNLKLGMIINFRSEYLKPKRVVNSNV